MEGGVALLHDLVVMPDRLLVGAFLLEARDVGAGHEGLAAVAGDHHHLDVVVAAEVVEHLARRLPHVERDGVVTLRIVEDHVADAALLA